MEKLYPRVKNYNVSVREVEQKVIFLRKLERGGSEHSFGIHVAKLAGMPKSIVSRANTILKELESANSKDVMKNSRGAKQVMQAGQRRTASVSSNWMTRCCAKSGTRYCISTSIT